MKAYIQANKERFFEELFTLLRIPSISAKPEHKADMYKCATRLTELLKEAGADDARVYETAGHPVVYGYKDMGAAPDGAGVRPLRRDMYKEIAADEIAHFRSIYEGAGYPVIETSVKTGEGISEIREACQGRVNLFSGRSM